MNESELIREIVRTYEKHGWELRRVLLREKLRDELGDSISGAAPVEPAEINALWFSRPSAGGEAWELRAVSPQPFALFEVFAQNISEAARESKRREMENRLKERARKQN